MDVLGLPKRAKACLVLDTESSLPLSLDTAMNDFKPHEQTFLQ